MEVAHCIQTRGGAATRAGRPTNLSIAFKGTYSSTTHAAEQRKRKAGRTEEQTALVKAGDADRAAKSQLKRTLSKQPYYIALDEKQKKQQLEKKLEKQAETRFEQQQSRK